MNALPDLADKKRSLDAHTTIATALVDIIKDRGLDRYFELEQGLSQERETTVSSTLRQALAPDAPGTIEDKIRLLACLYLSRRTPINKTQETGILLDFFLVSFCLFFGLLLMSLSVSSSVSC